jgi:hypothetical protein
MYAYVPVKLSWCGVNIGGHTKRAVAIAVVIATANTGAAIGGQIYRNDDGKLIEKKDRMKRATPLHCMSTFSMSTLALTFTAIEIISPALCPWPHNKRDIDGRSDNDDTAAQVAADTREPTTRRTDPRRVCKREQRDRSCGQAP